MTAAVRLLRRLVLEAPERTPDGSGGFAVELGAGRDALGRRDGADRRARTSIAGRRAAAGALPDRGARRAGRGGVAAAAGAAAARGRAGVLDILTVAERDADGRYLEILAEEGVLS